MVDILTELRSIISRMIDLVEQSLPIVASDQVISFVDLFSQDHDIFEPWISLHHWIPWVDFDVLEQAHEF